MKAGQITSGFIRSRLTDADAGGDSCQEGASGARAVAVATMCLYLNHIVQSRDQDCIARIALSVCAGAIVEESMDLLSGRTSWAASIPFDGISACEQSIAAAPVVQSGLLLQDAGVSFVETLQAPLQQQFTALVRRAFAEHFPENFRKK